MVRTIVGVIVGYLAMVAVVFSGLTGAYLALGADRTFQPNRYELTTTWLAVWLVVSLAAALVGGFIAAWIGRGTKAVVALVVVVLVLGLVSAVPVLMAEKPAEPVVRTGDVGNTDAMMKAQPPVWVALANPILGAVGVLLGGRLRGRPNPVVLG